MSPDLKTLCAGNEVEIALLIVILILAIGKGGGMALLQLVKGIFGHAATTVNVGTTEQPDDHQRYQRLSDTLEPCYHYETEHQRSIDNQTRIKEIEKTVGEINVSLGKSLQDRQEMRGFVEDINRKVDSIVADQGQVLGKLSLIQSSLQISFK